MRQLDEFLDPKLGARPRGKPHLMPVSCDDGVCAGRLAVPPWQQPCKPERPSGFLAAKVKKNLELSFKTKKEDSSSKKEDSDDWFSY